MQIASSASCAGSESRSASEYATTASTPSVLQALRIRSAISPRLAMRMRRNISASRPSARLRGGGELDPDQLLPVFDRGAALDERRPDDPVRRREDVLRDADDVDRPEA